MSMIVEGVIDIPSAQPSLGRVTDRKPYTYCNPRHYATQEDYDKVLQVDRNKADLITVASKVVKDRFVHQNVGKYRVEMLVAPDSMARLNALMVTCETDSPADIVANALRLYEHMVGLHDNGCTFTMTVDGSQEPFKPFG